MREYVGDASQVHLSYQKLRCPALFLHLIICILILLSVLFWRDNAVSDPLMTWMKRLELGWDKDGSMVEGGCVCVCVCVLVEEKVKGKEKKCLLSGLVVQILTAWYWTLVSHTSVQFTTHKHKLFMESMFQVHSNYFIVPLLFDNVQISSSCLSLSLARWSLISTTQVCTSLCQ